MTESRLENRASPIPNGESASGPVIAKTTTTTTTITTKLNPSAKSFVFNTDAPVWTPSFSVPAPAPVVASPALKPALAPVAAVAAPVVSTPLTPASPAFVPAAASIAVASPAPKLKAEAKPFFPSSMAKPSVSTFAVPAPIVAEKEEPEVEAAQIEAAGEPESEDIKEPVESVVAEIAAVTSVTEEVVEVEEVVVETTETKSEDAVEAEQAVIGERIIYSITQLLEMEPEKCPMPASVVGLPVAAETTGKASNTFTNESPSKGGRGGGGSHRGESSRSLKRSNSNYSEGGRGGGRRGGRGGRGHNPHDTAPAAEDCAPLDINEETRWKPTHAKSRLDAPEDTTEASLKEAKSILNKLSIEKFEKLSNELIAVAVRNIDVLTGVIETIILKAKMEWHFSTMYAELCTKMSRTQMPAVTIDDEVVEDTHKLFRRLLLKRCEQEFLEAPSREGFELLSEEEVAEKELIIKRGILGHIRFVGELFKLRMIKSRIMHQCVANLFGDTENPDEESLECLTNLLATIGQVFEMNASGESELAAIAQYYAVIKALSSDSARLSTRIRFMLQDLLDLRKNKWVARRKETKAMTIAEVHAEAKREADEKAKASASNGGGGGGSNGRLQRSQSMNAASDKRRNGGGSNGGGASEAWKARAAAVAGGAPASSPSAPTVDADGWETVASGKPKLVKTRSNSDRFPSSVSSSPGGGRPPKSNATRGGLQKELAGSSRGGGRRDRERSGSSSSVGGGFSALRRGNSMNDLGRPPTSQQPLTKSTSSTSSTASESETKKKEAISAEAFEKKVKSILEEYIVTRDIEEATQCFLELSSEEHHALITAQSLNIGLEKGNKERDAISSFLAGLYERKLLTSDTITTPLHELLEFAEDMEIDIPLTLQYIAEMVAPSVASGAVPLPRLVESVQHMSYNGKAAKVISKTLVAIGDDAKIKQLVDDAALDFLPLLAEAQRHDDGLKAFYSEAKLEILLA